MFLYQSNIFISNNATASTRSLTPCAKTRLLRVYNFDVHNWVELQKRGKCDFERDYPISIYCADGAPVKSSVVDPVPCDEVGGANNIIFNK